MIMRPKGSRGYGWEGRITSDYLYGTLGLYYDYHVQRL